MTHEHNIFGSLTTSVITAFIALIPDYAAGYIEKLISVVVLAMAAEGGRRLVGLVWKPKK